MTQADTDREPLAYLGEGDISFDKIRQCFEKDQRVLVWGDSKDSSLKSDESFQELIKSALEGLQESMEWRKRFSFSKKDDPIKDILGDNVDEFYNAFDDLRKQKISIVAGGPRTEHPFLMFVDDTHFVAGLADPSQEAIYYGYGLLETWRADPRVLEFNGKGVSTFAALFRISIVSLITQYTGLGLKTSRRVQGIFDRERILELRINELVRQTQEDTWPGTAEGQRKASIALRGYLNAWFDFMAKSGWLEIHHTLQDSKVSEREQGFLDTATTEISETSRDIIIDQSFDEAFDAAERERREKERREKQMQWTMMRIALGILYPREKEILRKHWEKERRGMTWKQLQETYYEEIWDLIRLHLAGADLDLKMEEKDKRTLGKMHFIFELKRSERPKEKVRTLEQFSVEELNNRKELLLSNLQWEGKGLSADSSWRDIVVRFRKLMIRYHPDRIEVTGINPEEAQKVSSEVIEHFRELEIIHELHPELFK